MPGTLWYNSSKLLRVTKVFKVWCLCAKLEPSIEHGPSITSCGLNGNSYREVLIVLLGSSVFSLDWKTCSV